MLLIKVLLTSSPALAAGDPTAGEKVFASHCAVCHATTPGENKIGPSLAGIAGGKSGTVPGFDFSAAMKDANVTWDDADLPHAFAVCSFADELAVAAGKDPVEYLRDLLGPPRTLDLKALGVLVDYPNYGVNQLVPGIADQYLIDTGRLRGVIDLAAANSNWGEKLPPRQGRGVAVHRSFLSYVAVVAHVAVGNDGQVTIPRLDMAIDCGTVVNPDRVRAQLEGAAIMSIGNALYSQITMKNGSVQQSNYTDYLVPRIDITPETHVYFVENTHLPGGVGEPGVPPTAPAICNAICAATGKRIRTLPVDPQLLKA